MFFRISKNASHGPMGISGGEAASWFSTTESKSLTKTKSRPRSTTLLTSLIPKDLRYFASSPTGISGARDLCRLRSDLGGNRPSLLVQCP